MALRQVAHFSRPVIHLRIDVDRVVAAPRRAELVIPYALQICRLSTGPGTGDEQITPILKQELDETGIAGTILDDALVRRQIVPGVTSVPQRQGDPVKQLPK